MNHSPTPPQLPLEPSLEGGAPPATSHLRTDPVGFARKILGVSPWLMQEQVLDAISSHPRVAVAGGQGVGKGHVAASAMLWYLYTHKPSIVLSTAPTERQVERLLWGEIRRQWSASELRPFGRMTGAAELRLAPGWYAYGFSTCDSDRFQGFHAPNMLVVIDEAAGVSRDIFEAVDAVLTGADARLLLIGNPISRQGRFYEAFNDPSFVHLRIPCTEHPNVTQHDERDGIAIPGAVSREWIEYVRTSYGEESAYWQARVLAQFPTEDSDSLMQTEWIERAAEACGAHSGDVRSPQRKRAQPPEREVSSAHREASRRPLPTRGETTADLAPRCGSCAASASGKGERQCLHPAPAAAHASAVGADIARFGNDSTAIVVAEGGSVLAIRCMRKRDLVAVADAVERAARTHHVPPEMVHIDDTGLGGGVTDMLRDRGLAVRAVQFGARARAAARFVNRKAEIIWHMRQLFEAGAVCLSRVAGTRDGRILNEQLALLRAGYAEDGRIRVEGAPGPLAAPSTSPDHADALALALVPLELPGPYGSPAATDAEAVQRRAGIWLG